MIKNILVSERTQKIRKAYLKMPVPMETNPYIDKKYRHFRTGDKWITLGFLEGWEKHCKETTTRLRRAYAQAEELYFAQPIISDDEILTGHLYLPEYTPEQQKRYDELCDAFQMSSLPLFEGTFVRSCHIALDFETLLTKGINGLKADIIKKQEALNLNGFDTYPNFDTYRREDFYNCCIVELDAVLDLAKRYSDHAKSLAEKASEPRKSELLKMSEILSKVPAEPAETFYEAVQSVQFFLSTLFGLYPLGRPDRYFYKYYKKDIENGTLTKEFAQELVDNLCLHISTRVFSRAACGFIVGGRDEKGNVVENDLTYMFLTALDHIHLPDPNGALAVCSDTSEEILRYSAEILSHGTTHPAFYNDDEIIKGFMSYGYPYEDAVNYIHTTCAELTIIGKTKAHTTIPFVNLASLMLETVSENPACPSFESLKNLLFEKVKKNLQTRLREYTKRMMEATFTGGNDPFRVSCLINDCIERGRDIHDGGAVYTNVLPTFVGFASTVDSMNAVNELVYKNKELTLEQFYKIAETNFEGHEELRQRLINKLPHYGNDNADIDLLAKEMAGRIEKLFKDKDIPLYNKIMPGTFSYVLHANMGAQTGATFDGRLAGVSLSDGCGPVQGIDTNGPTSMINSLTSWNQSAFLGGMVVNIKFGTDFLDSKVDLFLGVIRSFMERGGLELQVNVVDRATLEDARIHPENHGELMVRIGGYSDYFVRLTPVLQQELINRTQH